MSGLLALAGAGVAIAPVNVGLPMEPETWAGTLRRARVV